MRPKDFYDQNTIQENSRHIFTLMPPEFETEYLEFIKKPIESIELESGKVQCESYTDFETGKDQVDQVWKSIQKASVIIANITGFKPNVMLELGVALMKKGRVILIAEKNMSKQEDLPFNISTLGVEYYESTKIKEFSERIKSQVEKWIAPEEPKIKDPRVIKLLNDVLGLRREKKFDPALLLFESMDRIEPKNWYIYKEWGITYKNSGDNNNACIKLKKALDYAKANRYKSEIHTELGVVYYENKMENEALISFEKAENLDRDNAILYDRWAFLYYKISKYNEAMNKMMIAVKLEPNNEEYKLKSEFYMKKILDPTLTTNLEEWIKNKSKEIESSLTNNSHTPSKSQTKKKFFENTYENFVKFKNRHKPKENVEGKILKVIPHVGIFVGFELDIFGLILKHRLPNNFDVKDSFKVGKTIIAKILYYHNDDLKVDLALSTKSF